MIHDETKLGALEVMMSMQRTKVCPKKANTWYKAPMCMKDAKDRFFQRLGERCQEKKWYQLKASQE